MSNGMRNVIVSIAEIVSSMWPSFKARIRENVEPHSSDESAGYGLALSALKELTRPISR